MSDVSDVEDTGAAEAQDTSATDKNADTKAVDTKAAAEGAKDTTKAAADKGTVKAEPAKKTVATGSDAADKADAPTWADDWRERLAKGNAKTLKQLQRYASPEALWEKTANLEKKLNEKGTVPAKPGKDATPEQVAEYRRAAGIPEKPADYFEQIKLANGAVIGEADKPLADSFAEAMHGINAPPEIVAAGLDWYYATQAKQAEELVRQDDAQQVETSRELKKEWGGAYERNVAAISSLFAELPGGADPDNPESVMARLLAGRTADGKIIGDDPAIVRTLVAWAKEMNPMATLTLPNGGDPRNRLEEIRALRRTDPDKYNADKKMQAEELELIEAELALKNRGKAA